VTKVKKKFEIKIQKQLFFQIFFAIILLRACKTPIVICSEALQMRKAPDQPCTSTLRVCKALIQFYAGTLHVCKALEQPYASTLQACKGEKHNPIYHPKEEKQCLSKYFCRIILTQG
jgi:hypothetical protein